MGQPCSSPEPVRSDQLFGVLSNKPWPFLHGHYDEAASAARKISQSNPNFSMGYVALAAALAKIGRLDEAKAAASRVIELQPSYTISGMCALTPIDAMLAASLSEALRAAGLPE